MRLTSAEIFPTLAEQKLCHGSHVTLRPRLAADLPFRAILTSRLGIHSLCQLPNRSAGNIDLDSTHKMPFRPCLYSTSSLLVLFYLFPAYLRIPIIQRHGP